METIKMPKYRWVDQEVVVYIYSGILLGYQKETFIFYSNMGVAEDYIKRSKLVGQR